jgi:mRNA-degrading endonuclease toxin of MazEF toxin-antitoxin module
MKTRQWEIWKAKPVGFEKAHWFVILSGQERLDSNRNAINALACYTLRGEKKPVDVVLNGADGFDHATICQCDHIFSLDKNALGDPLGPISWERQQQIKSKLKEVFRL